MFLTKSAPERITLGIVYAPMEVDSQGDYATADAIEKACYDFNRRLHGGISKSAQDIMEALLKAEPGDRLEIEIDTDEDVTKGVLGINHKSWPDDAGDVLESYILPVDATISGQVVKAGTWLMKARWNPDIYERIQKGELTGYSLGGRGSKVKTAGIEKSETMVSELLNFVIDKLSPKKKH